MRRIRFYEYSGNLKIEILIKDSQRWLLPMLLCTFPGFCCSLALIYIEFLAFLKNIEISLILTFLGIFLFVVCGYGVISWLFNSFGKEILIFDNKRECFSYKKALFNIGITKRFKYNDISTLHASDSLLPYQTMRRTDIWPRCKFDYKGKKIRFGYLKTLADATEIIDMINQYISMPSQYQSRSQKT